MLPFTRLRLRRPTTAARRRVGPVPRRRRQHRPPLPPRCRPGWLLRALRPPAATTHTEGRVTYEKALAAATAPRSCPACGRLFIGPAFTVHRDCGRCLPGDAYGQLVQVDGAWVLRGSAAAPR
jgi:hypothetical protein